MYVRIDTSQLKFNQTLMKLEVATNYGTRKVAEGYRDRVKENFIEASRGSRYEAKSFGKVGGKGSITHAMVVSEKALPGFFTVGPKQGGMNTSGGSNPNYLSYDTILRYNEEGTGQGEPWTFKLKGQRQSASGTDGYWTTYGIKPKRFFEKTYREYSSGRLKSSSELHIRPLIKGVLD